MGQTSPRRAYKPYIRRAFDYLDKNGDGVIDINELHVRKWNDELLTA